MKNIGIDIGTTTISIVVTDNQNFHLEKKYTIDNGSFILSKHSWERLQDPQIILSKVKKVLEEIVNSYNDISAIGLTGQMHGIVYTDKTGAAVSPLYTWQDGRGGQPDFEGSNICSEIKEKFDIKLPPGYGMSTHLYNVRKGIVPSEAVSFCTIGDYVGMVLTGRISPLVHISQAMSMGLYNYQTKNFMTDVIASCGADLSLLPPITEDLVSLGLYQGIPVSVSIGDNQASFLGSVRDGENTILVNVGTGSQISVLSDTYCDGPGIEARPITGGLYLLVGSAICGGSAFAALEKFFREYAVAAGAPDTAQYEIMKRLAKQQADHGWKIKTTFSGTRECPDEIGSIQGINIANFHPASMIRGVLYGMAEELHELYKVMEANAGIQRSRLLASGNGIRKNALLQDIMQECFGMSIEVEKNEEEAAVGAAISALAAVGELSVEQHLGLGEK